MSFVLLDWFTAALSGLAWPYGSISQAINAVSGVWQFYSQTTSFQSTFDSLVYKWTNVRNDNLIDLFHDGYIDAQTFLDSIYGGYRYPDMYSYYKNFGYGPNTQAVFNDYHDKIITETTLCQKLGLTYEQFKDLVGAEYLSTVKLYHEDLEATMSDAKASASYLLAEMATFTPEKIAEMNMLQSDPDAYSEFLVAIEQALEEGNQAQSVVIESGMFLQNFTMYGALLSETQNQGSNKTPEKEANNFNISYVLSSIKIAEEMMDRNESTFGASDMHFENTNYLRTDSVLFSSQIIGEDLIKEPFDFAKV